MARNTHSINKFKTRQERAKSMANGTLIDSETQNLQKLLPFKMIANDRAYNTKLIAIYCARLFPHNLNLETCYRLFRNHFSTSLTRFDDEMMVLDLSYKYRCFLGFIKIWIASSSLRSSSQ